MSSIACCARFRRIFVGESGEVLDGVRVQSDLDPQRRFTAVCAGATLSGAVDSDGGFWIWGDVHKGLFSAITSTYVRRYTQPQRIPLEVFGNSRVQQVALGDMHVLVRAGGRLYTGGFGGDGRLGSGAISFEKQYGPNMLAHVVVADTYVSDVAAGPFSSCFVSTDGRFFTFGTNYEGECARGDTDAHWAPAPVPGFGAGDVKAVQASMHLHVAVLDADGFLHTAGHNIAGQLGLGDSETRLLLSRVESGAMRMVACGLRHTLALDLLGRAWVCGTNDNGALGAANAASVSVLQRVEHLSDVVFVAAGVDQCMAVDSAGAVFAWGLCSAPTSEPLWWPGAVDGPLQDARVYAPQRFVLPARVGLYNLPLEPLRALALAMGVHTRLGASSPLCVLSADVLRQITEACVVRDPAA